MTQWLQWLWPSYYHEALKIFHVEINHLQTPNTNGLWAFKVICLELYLLNLLPVSNIWIKGALFQTFRSHQCPAYSMGLKKATRFNQNTFSRSWIKGRLEGINTAFVIFKSLSQSGDTHLQHRELQSELCQWKQCWWDAAPHQHWTGLGT